MGAVTDAISAMKVQQWGRTTLADGQWLQEKTFKQLNNRDIRLANEIDSINERIPTSGSSYDGLIPWITDGDLERNPIYVITDDTGTRIQNGASGDKQFYVAPSFSNDNGKVFGIEDGKAKWIDPLEVSFINNNGTSSKVDSLKLYWKGAEQTQLKAGANWLGSTVPTPASTDEGFGKVPVARYDSTSNRGYYNLERATDYRFGDTINHAPLSQDDGKVLTVTSGADGAYVDWKTAPNTVKFLTLRSYDNTGANSKLIPTVPSFTMPKTNAKYYGTIGFSTSIPGSYSIVPLKNGSLPDEKVLIYNSQCVNLRNVPSGQMCHYNFYFNANDPNQPFNYIGIKGDAVTSGANIDIDYCSVFYQE